MVRGNNKLTLFFKFIYLFFESSYFGINQFHFFLIYIFIFYVGNNNENKK